MHQAQRHTVRRYGSIVTERGVPLVDMNILRIPMKRTGRVLGQKCQIELLLQFKRPLALTKTEFYPHYRTVHVSIGLL